MGRTLQEQVAYVSGPGAASAQQGIRHFGSEMNLLRATANNSDIRVPILGKIGTAAGKAAEADPTYSAAEHQQMARLQVDIIDTQFGGDLNAYKQFVGGLAQNPEYAGKDFKDLLTSGELKTLAQHRNDPTNNNDDTAPIPTKPEFQGVETPSFDQGGRTTTLKQEIARPPAIGAEESIEEFDPSVQEMQTKLKEFFADPAVREAWGRYKPESLEKIDQMEANGLEDPSTREAIASFAEITGTGHHDWFGSGVDQTTTRSIDEFMELVDQGNALPDKGVFFKEPGHKLELSDKILTEPEALKDRTAPLPLVQLGQGDSADPSKALLDRAGEIGNSKEFLRDLDPAEVTQFQDQLKAAGFDCGPSDGMLGQKTVAAWNACVEANDIDPNLTFDEAQAHVNELQEINDNIRVTAHGVEIAGELPIAEQIQSAVGANLEITPDVQAFLDKAQEAIGRELQAQQELAVQLDRDTTTVTPTMNI
jgi:hypothetical protein